LPELFDLLADLLGLGPGPDHLGLDAALVGPATDLEEAGVVQIGDVGLGETAQILGLLSALAQSRKEFVDGGQDRLRVTLLKGRHCNASRGCVTSAQG
jgi:hypothetical protein